MTDELQQLLNKLGAFGADNYQRLGHQADQNETASEAARRAALEVNERVAAYRKKSYAALWADGDLQRGDVGWRDLMLSDAIYHGYTHHHGCDWRMDLDANSGRLMEGVRR